MRTPAVSVVLCVRDGLPWLAEAVASVLAQTEPDLELIVVDDGSRDGSADHLAAVTDARLRVERRPPRGLTAALNVGLGLCRAPLVARLDADDTACPERLARQRAFLAARPEVGLLGTGAREIDERGREVGTRVPPVGDAALRRALIRANPFVHSSVMTRRVLLEAVGGYDERLPVAQDYDLWLRLSAVTRLDALPAPLVVRRLVGGRVSLARENDRLRTEARARWRAVRGGTYPWWCAAFAARPLFALALPAAARARLRRARTGTRRGGGVS